MIKLELDLLNLSAGDLQYAANMIAKVAADKQAVAEQLAKAKAEAENPAPQPEAEPNKTTEIVQ